MREQLQAAKDREDKAAAEVSAATRNQQCAEYNEKRCNMRHATGNMQRAVQQTTATHCSVNPPQCEHPAALRVLEAARSAHPRTRARIHSEPEAA